MNVVEKVAGVPDTGPLANALAARKRLMALTQASHDAALSPRDPGSISPDERAALAERMSRHCRNAALAAHYAGLRGGSEAALADPEAGGGNPRAAAILAYVDKATLRPRDAAPEDIQALRAAGLAEADIVRLAGLVAFVNYQIRLAHSLTLMAQR